MDNLHTSGQRRKKDHTSMFCKSLLLYLLFPELKILSWMQANRMTAYEKLNDTDYN